MLLFDQEFYNKNGYAHLGKTLTREQLKLMKQECMKNWFDLKEGYDANKNWLKNTLLQNIHHHSDAVRNFYFYGPFIEIMTKIIGDNIKGVQSQLSFKLKNNEKRVGWHQDNGYGELDPYNTVTTITSFDDSNIDNGCIWLIPGSHLWGQQELGFRVTQKWKNELNEIDLSVNESDAIPIPLKAGESIIFHCLMLHKSNPNRTKKYRRYLFLRYADADAVEVYNHRKPRLGKLLNGTTSYQEVNDFEKELF